MPPDTMKLLLILLLPWLAISYDSQDDVVELEIIVSPTTNTWWLQFSTNLVSWDTVQPELDAFPGQWTTNYFAVLGVQGYEPQVFFRASTDSNAVMSAMVVSAPSGPGSPVTDKKVLKIIAPPRKP